MIPAPSSNLVLLNALQALDVARVQALLTPTTVHQTPALLPELCAMDDDAHIAPSEQADRRGRLMDLLLAAGANPMETDHEGMTPVAWAAVHNRWSEVARLMQDGADPYQPDPAGDTVLDHLLQDEHGPTALALLMGAGFQPERLVHNGAFDGLRLFQYQRWSDENLLRTFDHLLAQGVTVPLPDAWRWTVTHGWPRCMARLVSLGADPQGTWTPWDPDLPHGPHGETVGPWTALHQAAYDGHAHLLPDLLALGLMVNQPDDWGITPLHAAVLNPRQGSCATTVVQTLLDAGARLNVRAQGLDGATPLDVANVNRHPGRGVLEAHTLSGPSTSDETLKVLRTGVRR